MRRTDLRLFPTATVTWALGCVSLMVGEAHGMMSG